MERLVQERPGLGACARQPTHLGKQSDDGVREGIAHILQGLAGLEDHQDPLQDPALLRLGLELVLEEQSACVMQGLVQQLLGGCPLVP